jgi:hypothetical protein
MSSQPVPIRTSRTPAPDVRGIEAAPVSNPSRCSLVRSAREFLCEDKFVQQSFVFGSHPSERQAASMEILIERVESRLGARPYNLAAARQFELD